jgi:transposase
MERKKYPSDLTDAEWAILKPLIPEEKSAARRREVDMREILNGILYVLHSVDLSTRRSTN